MSNRIEVEEGSGNVFADIGLPNPEERLAKADLAIRIGEAIRGRRLTQTRAAHILRIDQPKISRLLRGQLSGFSTERLMHRDHAAKGIFASLRQRDSSLSRDRPMPTPGTLPTVRRSHQRHAPRKRAITLFGGSYKKLH